MENSSATMNFTPYEKLDGIARWLGMNVASAFFASLERCSCVNLTTYDDDDDEEAKDRPLMLTNLQHSASVNSTVTATATSVENLPV